LSGPGAEATVEWDVSPWINTAARVNDLKLTVRNNAGNGKKTRNDRVYVIVTYHEP
jgi:PKD repeat protein